jgi:GNAT superfamily N-acetyltransferase
MAEAASWFIEPLARHHNRAAFSCGNEALDRYLKEIARQDARRHVAAPFVLIEQSSPKTILGYYTLSAFSVDLGDLPPEVASKLPSYPIVPATLLGRLAVDSRHHGHGIGELLLMDALQRVNKHSSQIATVAVIVDAIDQNAVEFYKHFEFIPFPNRHNRLFLPMQTIAALSSSKT